MPNMSLEKTKRKTQEANIRKNNFNEVFSSYSEEESINEANRCLNCPKPNCKEGCPIHNNIPEFLSATREKNYKKAYELLMENTCFPDICGTVCPHEDQCEGHCIRGIKGEGVGIGAIENFIAEQAIKNNYYDDEFKFNGHKVACIGSGPASMAFALKMSKMGYKVTMYEKENYLGGVLKWGIPSYRLDESVTERYFERLKKLNVEFVMNTKIGKDYLLENIIKENDGVFIGVGAPNSNSMHINGEDLEGVYAADTFLSAINLNEKDEQGRKYFDKCGSNVLIVGGGNVAMDAARDAIRLPQVKKVTIVYRRSEEEMPACKEELNHAKEEGIEFLILTNPVAFIGKNGKLTKVECAIMELGEPDASGRRRPVETSKPHLFIDIDTAVLALGFSNDLEISETTKGLDADKWGCFTVDENYKTSLDFVYAGGDAVTGAQTVVLAMKAGIKAAYSLDKEIKEKK